MSYSRYNYSSPHGARSYSSSNYTSPSGNNRYSSSSTYESSRSGSGLGGSKYGGGGGSGGSLSNLSSSRYSDSYSSPLSYGSSSYSPSSSSYSRTSKYDSSGSSYTPRSGYSSRYSKPTSSYDSEYSRARPTSSYDSDYSRAKPTSSYDSSSSKYRSSNEETTSSRPARKTRFADEEYSKPDRKKVDTSVSVKTSDDSITSKSRQRRREKEEGSSPVPTRSADADISSVTQKTESLTIDNSSQQSAPKTAGGPKPFVPSGSPARGSPAAQGDGVATMGKSAMNQQSANPDKAPVCAKCTTEIRGPFVLALNKSWCPNHFTCSKCDSELVNMGFVELNGSIYCENDYENFFAPKCAKCRQAIIGSQDTVNALDKTWHPTCFVCEECGDAISSGAFHVEEGRPYCMKDWQRLYQTKCTGCSYPVEPGDKWIEALDANWHSECFVCGVCKIQLEGKPFFPRDGKPFCKEHAAA